MNNQQKLAALGIEVPEILLPDIRGASDFSKWPVIACDQFTQDRGYWEKTKVYTGGSPSTLNLIFPEVFLTDDDDSQQKQRAGRIADIHSNMKRYLNDGVFAPPRKGFVYIERDTPYQKKRRGLVAAIDLEKYDWHPDARPLIRSTEGTVPERLPPRMDIRRGAPLELPHVLLLIDDSESRAEHGGLLSELGERVKNNAPCYSTRLMMDSGHVKGWFIEGEDDVSFIADKLDELCRNSVNRYGFDNKEQPFLFAVGDGNHSLAAAKGIWDEYKKTTANPQPDHPLRYALVEIENIYDPAILFEPIHRLVFGIDFDGVISILSQLPDFSCRQLTSRQELSKAVSEAKTGGNSFGIISQGHYALAETSASGIATACLQPLLDNFPADGQSGLCSFGKYQIDYIHDEDELFRLSDSGGPECERAAGILLPPVHKSGLFETIARTGPLPRKSFSMGHSCEKRFYLECRRLSV